MHMFTFHLGTAGMIQSRKQLDLLYERELHMIWTPGIYSLQGAVIDSREVRRKVECAAQCGRLTSCTMMCLQQLNHDIYLCTSVG